MNNRPGKWCAVLFGVLMAAGLERAAALPMIPVNFPFVSVQAATPLATEPGGQAAVFTFSRVGTADAALTVFFSIGGTATNGVDYVAVTNSVTFAAGQTSTNVVITPISEPLAEGYKTVIFSLPGLGILPIGPIQPIVPISPVQPMESHVETQPVSTPNFIIGPPSRAVAYIVYNYTNIPPTVEIVRPANGRSYLSMPNIEIAAEAYDSNGWVSSVGFFANGTSLGVVSNPPFGGGVMQPLVLQKSHGSILPILTCNHGGRYQFVWTNVPPGNYALTAVATDNAGQQTTSSAVDIVVTTNLPVPVVRIVSPRSGAEFSDWAKINIFAAAGETNGVVNTVEFLANGVSLGVATNYLAAEPNSPCHLEMQWLPYFFRWTNAAAGSNILTAVATDNNGTQATSAPVSINVFTNFYHFPHRW
jgi:hypothetical protein